MTDNYSQFISETIDLNTHIMWFEKSNKYIVLGHHSTLASDIQLLNADNPNQKLKRFTPRLKKHLYTVVHIQNKFYIVSNWNAKNFRLMKTNENQTNRKFWKEIVPNRKTVFLEDNFECFISSKYILGIKYILRMEQDRYLTPK